MWEVLCFLMLVFGVFLAVELNPRQRKRAALMRAISKNDLGGVQRIVDSNLNLNFNYTWQMMRLGSPVSSAFSRSDRSIADFLIARGASLSPKSPGNEALLTNAVRSGNPEQIDLALSAGHDIHFQPPKHSKPLARAIHHQWIPMARFLVSRGANKEDIGPGDCRWHAMQSATILFVHELGIEVPQDVLTAIENGDWDRRTPPKST
ncbi:MAG: hypothetical protein JWR26_4324 [Pedosphaera sp.]|nr:hypothetical protein [Pedosphaera sp.]